MTSACEMGVLLYMCICVCVCTRARVGGGSGVGISRFSELFLSLKWDFAHEVCYWGIPDP